jgi:hypothetical protein
MHEVEKIFVFLITLASTISGLATRQEFSPFVFVLPTSQPIATDWEMSNETSHVTGSTHPTQTLTNTLLHPSKWSLYLTKPNLDPLGHSIQCCSSCSLNLLLLLPITLRPLHPLESPWNCSSTACPWSLLDIHQCVWTSPASGTPWNPFLAFFKFKNTLIVIEHAVKTPLPTCKTLRILNLPSGKFLSHLASLPMQRKIASFSSASKAPLKELAAKPLPKSDKHYSFREFNHDPIQLAAHRDDRIFRSSQIWIQGLPTDPLQAMEIIAHIGVDMKVSISPSSIALVGDLFTALNQNAHSQKHPNKNPIPSSVSPPMIGSTANSYATVVNLSKIATFSAVPIQGHVSTVTELVVRTTSASQQESFTTIVVVPWLIDTTSELSVILRFHHMGMDAKSELVHAIFHQLSLLSDHNGHSATQLQFIARIITVEKPLWVIDILAPFGNSSIHINHHFTGNSAGSSETLELDGIPTQVLGGYGITNAPLPGFAHPPLSWANLPVTQGVPLRYLAEIVTRMGCEGLVSILYAKADPIRVSRHRHDRHSMNQKANTLSAPTFIFRSPRHLKYFLDHFQQFMDGHLPTFMVGHAEVALPVGPTKSQFQGEPVPLKTYLAGRTFSLYLSNDPGDRHRELQPPKPLDAPSKFDHFEAISGLLASARRDLPPDQFNAGLKKLAERYWPSEDLTSTLDGLQRIRFSPSRSTTPKRNRESPDTTPRILHQRRATPAAQEQVEARKNLDYTYFMEIDDADTDKTDTPPASVGQGDSSSSSSS